MSELIFDISWQEQLVAANPRSHANFQKLCSISCFWMFNWWPFADLINSKDCTHEYNILIFSDLKKVYKTFFKNTKYQSEKTHIFLAKEFWSQCHILSVKRSLSRPAGVAKWSFFWFPRVFTDSTGVPPGSQGSHPGSTGVFGRWIDLCRGGFGRYLVEVRYP